MCLVQQKCFYIPTHSGCVFSSAKVSYHAQRHIDVFLIGSWFQYRLYQHSPPLSAPFALSQLFVASGKEDPSQTEAEDSGEESDGDSDPKSQKRLWPRPWTISRLWDWRFYSIRTRCGFKRKMCITALSSKL